MKLRNKILTTLLVLFIIIAPLVTTGAYWIRNVGLLPGTSVVFSDDTSFVDKMMATVFHGVYGDRCNICDGVADDVQIQGAIAALPNDEGTVIFSDGTYTCAAKITVPPNVWLVGQGGQSTELLLAGIADNCIEVNAGGANSLGGGLRNLYIHGDKTVGSVGVYVENVVHFAIENCFIGQWDTGVRLTNASHLGNISNCRIWNTTTYTILIDNDSNGCSIHDNWIEPYEGYAIKLDGASATFIYADRFEDCLGSTILGYIYITGNSHFTIIDDCTTDTNVVHTSHMVYIDAHGVIVSNSYWSGTQGNGIHITANGYGSKIIDNTRIAGDLSAVYVDAVDCVVSGNHIWDAGQYGIEVTASADRFEAIGNTILNSSQGVGNHDNIEVRGDYSRIIGNHCYDDQGGAYTVFMGIDVGATHCVIDGNITSGALGGIYVSGDYHTVVGNTDTSSDGVGIHVRAEHCTITGNTVYDAGDEGIWIDRVSYNTVTANTIVGGRRGINVDGAIGFEADHNIVTDNEIRSCTQDGIKLDAYARYTYVGENTITNSTIDVIDDAGVGTIYTRQHVITFIDVLAEDDDKVVNAEDISGGGDINCVIAAQPDAPRNLTLTVTDGNASITEFTITVTGVDAKGNTVTEVWVFSDGLVQTGDVAFATVTSVVITDLAGAGVGDLVDVGIGSKLGLSNIIYATGYVYKVTRNAADYPTASYTVNATYHTVDMSIGAGIVGGDDYTVWFRVNLNVIG